MAKTKTTYEIKPEWMGSVTTVFTDRERTIELSDKTSQEQMETLFNIGHPAIKLKE